MPKKDLSQLAKSIVEIATGQVPKPKTKAAGQQKGGLKGGPSRAEKLTPERRKEIAQKAAQKRWSK